jgi:uncharacterized protein YecE (DUF72 family)
VGTIYVGVSGWSYDDWRGPFYPSGLSKKDELSYLSRRFNSVEINGSFYGLLKPETYRHWYEQTPSRFLFAVKGSRFITHNKKLKDAGVPLANFFASGLLALRDKLGPILWQLPQNVAFDPVRLDRFLGLLPRDTQQAVRLGRKHDERVEGRSWLRPDTNHRLRQVLEVRHESFLTAEMVRIARRHGVALVFADSGSWPYLEELTAGFAYLRLHGSPETYASRYTEKALDGWANRIRAWSSGREPPEPKRITDRPPPPRKSRDVYVYFDNDQSAHAPLNALSLAGRF